MLRERADVQAISDAYRERLRLGLGSPFRLIEIAARDTRFTEADRTALLHDLFERTANGESYRAVRTLPLAHLHIIEHAVRAAHDPRVGELAVNLAYEIATAERTATPEVQYAAAGTAALLRDRALAQRDAHRVREWARRYQLEPYLLVPRARFQRLLSVEQPLQLAFSAAHEEEASRLALLLIGGVRQAARLGGVHAGSEPATKLTRDVAERILALQRPHERPPQSALIIAMRAARLPFTARDEETFVAELALIDNNGQLAAQRAALALRPFAQETPRPPGAPAPTAADMLTRFGVRVIFTSDVPAKWRPHYSAQLAKALEDMRLVLPALNLQGLTIEVGDVDAAAGHLAYHDPRGRIIRWAPSTGAGSLAHEIGHDLDWQIGRRAYKRKAGYASDYATDVAALMELTRPGSAATGRPTEVFARQFEWLIAGGLAMQGRMNGRLTSVQHDWLRGHGSAAVPAPSFTTARALSGMIDRGTRNGEDGGRMVERVVLAADAPAVVRAIRLLQHGLAPDAASATSPYVSKYVEELLVAHGHFRFATHSSQAPVTAHSQPFYLQVEY